MVTTMFDFLKRKPKKPEVLPQELDLLSRIIENHRYKISLLDRYTKVVLGFSFIQICLVSGMINLDENITIEWLNITLTKNLFIIGVSLIVFYTYQSFFSLSIETHDQGKRILDLHKRLIKNVEPYIDKDISYINFPQVLFAGFGGPFLRRTKLGRNYLLLLSTSIGLVSLVVPIVAQISAFFVLKNSFGWLWYMVLGFTVIVFHHLFLFASYIKHFWDHSPD